MSLDTLQAQLKADMDARKARHPFPGGWRSGTQPTRLERDVTKHIGKRGQGYGVVSEADCLIDTFDDRYNRPQRQKIGYQPYLIRDGRLYAMNGWIRENIVDKGCRSGAISDWLHRNAVRRFGRDSRNSYYDVADLIVKMIASKTLRVLPIRTCVARVAQGSGSINEKLLNFIAASE